MGDIQNLQFSTENQWLKGFPFQEPLQNIQQVQKATGRVVFAQATIHEVQLGFEFGHKHKLNSGWDLQQDRPGGYGQRQIPKLKPGEKS